MTLDVICLETEAYYKLIEETVNYVKSQHEVKEDLWVDANECMRLLGITSKTTLQKYRDDPENPIQFTQLSRKVILYYRPSIMAFLEQKMCNL